MLKEADSAEATVLRRACPLEVSIGSNCRPALFLAPVSAQVFTCMFVHVCRCKGMHEPAAGVQSLAFDAFHHSACCVRQGLVLISLASSIHAGTLPACKSVTLECNSGHRICSSFFSLSQVGQAPYRDAICE